MGIRNLQKKAATLASILIASTTFAVDPYILDDFENRDHGSDAINYNYGEWIIFDDNPPTWDMKTWDTTTKKFTDENGMLAGGNSHFTKMNDTEITEADISHKLIKHDDDTIRIEKIYPNVITTEGAGYLGGNNRGLKLEFKLGDQKPQVNHNEDAIKDGFVGISTALAPRDKYQQLNEYMEMEVSFKAKVDIPDQVNANHLDVEFHVQTKQEVMKLHDATYRVICNITEDWQTFTYKLEFGKDTDSIKSPTTKFYQHNWWNSSDSVSVDDIYWSWECEKEHFTSLVEANPLWEQSEKFKWIIRSPKDSTENNAKFVNQRAVIYIDDITINNYTPYFFDCITTDEAWEENPIDDTDLLLYSSGNINTIGGGNNWYTIDDTKNSNSAKQGGNSTISESFISEDGEHVGIKFTMGETFDTEIKEKSIRRFPYVGLAMNMYSDPVNDTGDFDVSSWGFNGIRFKYKTVGDSIDWVQLRMKDNQILHADGATFQVKIPATGGEWKVTTVSFWRLQLPWWDDIDVGLSLNEKAVRTIDFAYEGTPDEVGELYIDDVYLVTDAEGKISDPVIIPAKSEIKYHIIVGITPKDVNLTLPTEVQKAKITLYDLRGQLVSSQIVDNRASNIMIPSNNLTAKMYVLRVESLDASDINFAKTISVIK